MKYKEKYTIALMTQNIIGVTLLGLTGAKGVLIVKHSMNLGLASIPLSSLANG